MFPVLQHLRRFGSNPTRSHSVLWMCMVYSLGVLVQVRNPLIYFTTINLPKHDWKLAKKTFRDHKLPTYHTSSLHKFSIITLSKTLNFSTSQYWRRNLRDVVERVAMYQDLPMGSTWVTWSTKSRLARYTVIWNKK